MWEVDRMRNFKKLKQDLVDWHDWCMDKPNKSRGNIAYHIEKILEICGDKIE